LFAAGASYYDYRPVTHDDGAPRIVLHLLVADLEVAAYVDTGGLYLLCSHEVGQQLQLHPDESLGALRLLFRGIWYRGQLFRVPLTFIADEGEPLSIEVTAFIPRADAEAAWPVEFPCILGMSGCLERLRFAIDPASDTFYFGAL
jgi:hypothetical protein